MTSNRAFDRRKIPDVAALAVWKAPDGWLYRLLKWPRPPGGEVRGSLLFAGGRGDFIEKYLEIQHHWFGRGWEVTGLDWRGQGASRGAVEGGHLDSLDPLVDDLAALIGAWRRGSPGPHAVVGHSMGGHVLLRTLAERHPDAEAAVLVAPMLMINSTPLPPFAAAATASLMTMLGWGRHPAWHQPAAPPPRGSLRQTYLTHCAERYEDELWWWEKEPGYNLGAPSWGWLKAAYASCERLTPAALRGVETPVLLLGTERDRLVSPGAIRRAAALLPRAELLMFADAGHEILREADTIRLEALARIDGFLARHAPR